METKIDKVAIEVVISKNGKWCSEECDWLEIQKRKPEQNDPYPYAACELFGGCLEFYMVFAEDERIEKIETIDLNAKKDVEWATRCLKWENLLISRCAECLGAAIK